MKKSMIINNHADFFALLKNKSAYFSQFHRNDCGNKETIER